MNDDITIPEFLYSINAARRLDNSYAGKHNLETWIWEKYRFDDDGAHWINAEENQDAERLPRSFL